jgi:hypothetical protein
MRTPCRLGASEWLDEDDPYPGPRPSPVALHASTLANAPQPDLGPLFLGPFLVPEDTELSLPASRQGRELIVMLLVAASVTFPLCAITQAVSRKLASARWQRRHVLSCRTSCVSLGCVES